VDPVIYIITGYTAVGKTRFSLNWAKENEAEIISCDSLLFYEGMDIGTAKPTAEERAEVPHHLIDVVPPFSQYSIREYLRSAKELVSEIHARGKKVLVVGGSGFYLNSFFSPVVDGLELDSRKQMQIIEQFESQSLEASLEILRGLNPDGMGDLDVQNPRRVLKAWLRCVAASKPLIQIKADFENLPGQFDGYEKRLLVLSRPREELEKHIRQRVGAMLDDGLIDEVSRLLSVGLLENPSAANSIGYRETIAYLKGELTESQLADAICRNTRRLVKKQRTWFKKFLPEEAVVDVSNLTQLPGNWYVIPALKS
jgi:tRNA dimethylallyltransferase